MPILKKFGDHSGVAFCVAIVALAFIGAILPGGEVRRLAALTPICYAMVILGDAVTAYVLISTWQFAPVRSTIVLALMFASSTSVLTIALLALPLLPNQPTLIAAPTQSGIWMYVLWHILVAVGGLLYMFMLRSDGGRKPTKTFWGLACGTCVVVIAACFMVAFCFASLLPVLANGTSIARLITTGIGPATVVLLAMTTVLAFRIRKPTTIARALAVNLLALTLELAIFMAEGHRYSLSYYAGRLMLLAGAMNVLMAAVRTLVQSRVKLQSTVHELSVLGLEASKRAQRIRALWHISSMPDHMRETGFQPILAAATAVIRPGKKMFATLSHLDGASLVIDATSWTEADAHATPFEGMVYAGARFDLASSVHRLVYNQSETRAWNDLGELDMPALVGDNFFDLKSLIGKKINIGKVTHSVTFLSTDTMTDQPFVEDDCAFVDVVTSFFASRFAEKLQYERLRFQAEHDALTGLHNRAQFRRAVRDELRTGRAFTLAFVNLDGFRHVNEHQGHAMGDEVLVEVAANLASVDPDNFIARMSSDEFGLILRGSSSIEVDKTTTLQRYAQIFRKPIHLGGLQDTRQLRVGASIGAARFPADGSTAEELMRKADAALGFAKTSGGSAVRTFDSTMQESLAQAHVRLVELADAIEKDQLVLAYQPTFDLATRTITGAEALVRWQHPERGLLMPAEFVPAAERNGVITSLTRWVVKRLIQDLSEGETLPHGFRVYFNLAAQTLDDFQFIAELNERLRERPGIAAHLGVEMTETAAMQNVESAMHTISLFRRWGLSVAIDDFGTGYSSLAYLKKLTVDVIKIDRSFVNGLPHDERDGAIVETLLTITDRFGFGTLAEGIETEEQASWLLAHGCKYGQGYLYAKPAPLQTLRLLLRDVRVTA